MKRSVLVYLIAMLPLAGCDIGESHIIVPTPGVTALGAENESQPAVEPSDTPIQFTVWYETDDLHPGLYEPESGCYLGAQIAMDETETVSGFERRTQKKHTVYAYDMRLGDAFPEEWILNCIAAQATPLIILRPKGTGVAFSTSELTKTAAAFGAYNIPMFVAFFPITEQSDYDVVTYTLYYRYARSVFAENAPKAAFVWLSDARAEDSNAYYPGHEAVDWVGLSVMKRREDELDILTAIDRFYHMYQADKPIMLAPFAVSHFSADDYKYYTEEAAEELSRVYEAVQSYPRLKMMVYMDINGLSDESVDWNDDFSVSRDDLLLDVYRKCVTGRYFMSELEMDDTWQTGWLRSAYAGYYTNGQVYVDAGTLADELHANPRRESDTTASAEHPSYAPAEPVWLNGRRCIGEQAFDGGESLYVVTEHDRKLVTIYKKVLPSADVP